MNKTRNSRNAKMCGIHEFRFVFLTSRPLARQSGCEESESGNSASQPVGSPARPTNRRAGYRVGPRRAGPITTHPMGYGSADIAGENREGRQSVHCHVDLALLYTQALLTHKRGNAVWSYEPRCATTSRHCLRQTGEVLEPRHISPQPQFSYGNSWISGGV
jgi:hypothetical protein